MHIGGMQNGSAVRPGVDHPRGGRRHTGTNLLGAERVADAMKKRWSTDGVETDSFVQRRPAMEPVLF